MIFIAYTPATAAGATFTTLFIARAAFAQAQARVGVTIAADTAASLAATIATTLFVV
jgi:hypothetical protein